MSKTNKSSNLHKDSCKYGKKCYRKNKFHIEKYHSNTLNYEKQSNEKPNLPETETYEELFIQWNKKIKTHCDVCIIPTTMNEVTGKFNELVIYKPKWNLEQNETSRSEMPNLAETQQVNTKQSDTKHKRSLSDEIKKCTGLILPTTNINPFLAENQTGPFLAAKALASYYEIVKQDNEKIVNGKTNFSVSDIIYGLSHPCNIELVIEDHKITENNNLFISGHFEYKEKTIHTFALIRLSFRRESVMQGVLCNAIVVEIIDYSGIEKIPRIIWDPTTCFKNINKYPGSLKPYQLLSASF